MSTMEWLHMPDRPREIGPDAPLRFTETECTIGTAWMAIRDDEDPKIKALIEWLEFHGIKSPMRSVLGGTLHPIVRDVEKCQVRYYAPFRHYIEENGKVRENDLQWPSHEFTRRGETLLQPCPHEEMTVQGEVPPMPWPRMLWTPSGHLDPEPLASDAGSKEENHVRSADLAVAPGSQGRHLGVSGHRPDCPGDHRPDHLDRADGHRAFPRSPVTLDALGDSPLVGGLG